MRVTLRKAAQMQSALMQALETLNTAAYGAGGTVSLNIYEPKVTAAVEAARTRTLSSMAQAEEIEGALYELRALIGQTNASAGINDLMAQEAMLKRRIERLGRLAGRTAAPSSEAVEAQLQGLQKAAANGGGASRFGSVRDTVEVETLTAEDLQRVNAQLLAAKRALVETRDAIQGKNFTTELNVPASVLSVQQTYSIV